ncbi:MAG: Rrf2 family transcriptional regulator [Gemmatimonadota bacterium]
MVISQSSQYALRALLLLAEEADGESVVSVERIATELGMPQNYLSKLLNALVRSGLLSSRRGPRGGFRLRVPPGQVSLARVVKVFDPDLFRAETRCPLGRPKCGEDNPCAVHHRFAPVVEQLRDFFTGTSLQDLLEGNSDLVMEM